MQRISVSLDSLSGIEQSSIRHKSPRGHNLEPCSTWIILLGCVFPINILIGMDTTAAGIYYVAYTEYFYQNSSSEIGFINAVKMGLLFSFGGYTKH